jgi:hypothetical protein
MVDEHELVEAGYAPHDISPVVLCFRPDSKPITAGGSAHT